MEIRTQRPGTCADAATRWPSTRFWSSAVAMVSNPSVALTSETATVTWRAEPLGWLELAVSNSRAESTLFSASCTTIHCLLGRPVALAHPTFGLSSRIPAADHELALYSLETATTRAPAE